MIESENKIDLYGELDVSKEFAMELLQDDDVILIDVRTLEEINKVETLLEDTLKIDYYGDYRAEVNKLDKANPYLVYCAGGIRSKEVVAYMKDQGFQNVFNLKGGLKSWNDDCG